MVDGFAHTTSIWQVTKHHLDLSFYSKKYDWPVKELIKLTSEFWKLLPTVTVLKCSFPPFAVLVVHKTS